MLLSVNAKINVIFKDKKEMWKFVQSKIIDTLELNDFVKISLTEKGYHIEVEPAIKHVSDCCSKK